MGKFIISKRTNDDFQFNLKAGNGQVILTSQGYGSRSACENGIESVRTNSGSDSNFERKTASDDRCYFNLKAGNGQVIGTSQMYESENGMENGIESVKTNAPGAVVEDETGR
ncbi:uncharacterized protein YegP (UPF0339 family) [Chryseobacterium defluvii]|uniref:Uncharacterized protein YegP (UPF0339 family) n=1 Tax=Chryseobacterium defluvii TaxID=160396 RepID=A0A840K872_9FLAO|nr:YegP family protein [Chryseobacterium defluvii]MBB4805416.1 uncharacterized protein YegP (UPF0339 family) [Chryseobacterium defluvii]